MRSGLLRCGAGMDIECLQVVSQAEQVEGYGLGLAAPGWPMDEVVTALRASGIATTAPTSSVTDAGLGWSVIQVAGLLPEPFPVPVSANPLAWWESALAKLGTWVLGWPMLAKYVFSEAGKSMVVITEYQFDAQGKRTKAGKGPECVEIEIESETGSTPGQGWEKSVDRVSC